MEANEQFLPSLNQSFLYLYHHITMANTMSDNANKAAWLTEAKQNPLKVDHAPMPTPGPDEVVIKNKAVAVNPVDWKIQDYGVFIQSFPNILGKKKQCSYVQIPKSC